MSKCLTRKSYGAALWYAAALAISGSASVALADASAQGISNVVSIVRLGDSPLVGPTRPLPNQAILHFAPTASYFNPNTPSGWTGPGQWTLRNQTSGGGPDINVQGAWAKGYTGAGITVGDVDDGIDVNHVDLLPNLDLAHSYDFATNTASPAHKYDTEGHGTATAGIIAAAGNGVTGVAPSARIAAQRVDFSGNTANQDQQLHDATLNFASGPNPVIQIENHSYGVGAPWLNTTLDVSALRTSTAAGVVHVFSAGNSRGGTMQDTNKMQVQNSPDAITVAALGSNGQFASYSNFGACVFVTAPSSTTGGYGVLTTDRTGAFGYNGSKATMGDTFPNDAYTTVFGGTSAAAPAVTGVLALVKQAQPNLDTRMAQHLLALTSRVVDAGDASYESDNGWVSNSAGYHFNQNYGFGLVDATALVNAATEYSGVTPLRTYSSPTINVNTPLPDGQLVPGQPHNTKVTWFTSSITVPSSETTPLEQVLVTIHATHDTSNPFESKWAGELQAYLMDPAGHEARIMFNSTTDTALDMNWTFTMNQFWGEDPAGTWTLRIGDAVYGDTGTFDSWSMQLNEGSLIAAPEPGTLALMACATLVLGRRQRRAARV